MSANLKCQNCGAPLEHHLARCEYCMPKPKRRPWRVQYSPKDEKDPVLNFIVGFTFATCIFIYALVKPKWFM